MYMNLLRPMTLLVAFFFVLLVITIQVVLNNRIVVSEAIKSEEQDRLIQQFQIDCRIGVLVIENTQTYAKDVKRFSSHEDQNSGLVNNNNITIVEESIPLGYLGENTSYEWLLREIILLKETQASLNYSMITDEFSSLDYNYLFGFSNQVLTEQTKAEINQYFEDNLDEEQCVVAKALYFDYLGDLKK